MNLSDEMLLAVLIAFAVGVATGRLWSRLKRSSEDESRLHSWSISYILGLDLLASKKLDRAVDELTRAARENTEATDIYLVLGNLLREKGQLERAIQIHQSVLHRPRLSRTERAHALVCLGLDFRRAGFRDRALETLREVVALEPENPSALASLAKIYEEDQDWERALRTQEQLRAASGASDAVVEAFLHDRIGQHAESVGDIPAARRAYEAALRAQSHTAPARVHYGDLLEREGQHERAEAVWSELARGRPHLAHLVFERLARARRRRGADKETEESYLQTVEADDRDWRARRALAHLRSEAGRHAEAFDLLLEATRVNPHALPVQLDLFELVLRMDAEERTERSGGAPAALAGIRRYRDTLSHAAFFLDPHVCTRCHYRTNGILWRCPHCQEWDTFVEERLETPER